VGELHWVLSRWRERRAPGDTAIGDAEAPTLHLLICETLGAPDVLTRVRAGAFTRGATLSRKHDDRWDLEVATGRR
jgi:hypothetical protein